MSIQSNMASNPRGKFSLSSSGFPILLKILEKILKANDAEGEEGWGDVCL